MCSGFRGKVNISDRGWRFTDFKHSSLYIIVYLLFLGYGTRKRKKLKGNLRHNIVRLERLETIHNMPYCAITRTHKAYIIILY